MLIVLSYTKILFVEKKVSQCNKTKIISVYFNCFLGISEPVAGRTNTHISRVPSEGTDKPVHPPRLIGVTLTACIFDLYSVPTVLSLHWVHSPLCLFLNALALF